MNQLTNNNIAVGRFLISPLVRQLDDGRYKASVSIRSGRGQSTHDRILRLVPTFDTAADAVHFATQNGLSWLNEPAQR